MKGASIVVFVGLLSQACAKDVSNASKAEAAAAKAAVKTSLPKDPCGREIQREAALKSGTKVLGGVKLKTSLSQGEILANAALYEGKAVRIEGKIRGICQAAGCWAALEDATGQRLNLKVTDGVIDFRKLAKNGQYAVGEGIFTKAGHHGSQVKITGAMIAERICK